MVLSKIGNIRRKLDACISLNNSLDSAVRVYEDAVILVDQTFNLMIGAEQTFEEISAAVEAALKSKESAAKELKKGAEELVTLIKNTKRGGSEDPAAKASEDGFSFKDALSLCLAVRETVNKAANKTAQMKSIFDSAVEYESITSAALDTAESAWIERVRVYEDAVAAAEAAQASMIEAASILGV